MYTYDIENNQLFFYDLSGKLVISQSGYPNGENFDTHEEADAWAQSFIASVLGVSEFGPKLGKNIDPISKDSLTAEEISKNAPAI